VNLAAQAWLNDAKTRTLLAAFGDVPLRFVGGCVRDAVMGRNVGDIDCATPAKPEEVVALLEAADIKAVPTGLAHGTITAVIDSKPFEITTLRKDVACDGRHAEVEYTDDWQQDALRRDFTMNALYCDAHGEVFDYTDGVDAARAGRIQFIGDAEARIREDGLRILRFFRFFATHGLGAPDTTALKACAAHKAMLADLSGERIQQEMLKLCAAESPYAALEAMQQGDVLAALLPQATLGHHSAHPHPLLRLALSG
jgi:poly(A) polymerase